jgi:hypothetical protein
VDNNDGYDDKISIIDMDDFGAIFDHQETKEMDDNNNDNENDNENITDVVNTTRDKSKYYY